MGVSESRTSQVLAQAMSAQKARIQAADASLTEGERQRKEQAALSRKVQDRLGVDEQEEGAMERLRSEARCGMAARALEAIPQSLLGSFECATF